jgi:hypothetical protein
MTKDARGVKLGFGVLNFGFRNYAFLIDAIRQFASGGLVTRPNSCHAANLVQRINFCARLRTYCCPASPEKFDVAHRYIGIIWPQNSRVRFSLTARLRIRVWWSGLCPVALLNSEFRTSEFRIFRTADIRHQHCYRVSDTGTCHFSGHCFIQFEGKNQ